MNDLSSKLSSMIRGCVMNLNEINEKNLFADKSTAKWSDKEILGHLIDSAINNYRRFLISATEGVLHFDGYQQEKWVELQNYNDLSWGTIIKLWVDLNSHISRLISGIPEELLVKKHKNHNLYQIGFGKFEKNAAASLEDFIKDYICHIEHHIIQILKHHDVIMVKTYNQ